MATQRTSFAKRERDRAKKAKQAAKRESRLDKPDDEDVEDETPVVTEPAEVVMEKLAKLHEAFENDQIEFEDFEEQKADLMARMPIE